MDRQRKETGPSKVSVVVVVLISEAPRGTRERVEVRKRRMRGAIVGFGGEKMEEENGGGDDEGEG